VKRIAVLTSGGDAPGMNAAVRAVTRCAIDLGWEVRGVRHGFTGLIDGDLIDLDARSVAGIIHLGGTILGSARCAPFETDAGRARALAVLRERGVDALVVIGGNGSQAGSLDFSRLGLPVVGVASTIDNDLAGSDITIGVDTALNIALEAIDRIKTTASSHRRAFVIEVMGRNCGYLALVAGITGGAEVVVLPEVETTPEQVATELQAAYRRGKAHAIAVVAEGARYASDALAAFFRENRERIGFDLRTITLGHVQRGGAPTAYDRLLATRLGAGAVATLDQGCSGVLVGMRQGAVTKTPLAEVVGVRKPLDPGLLTLAKVLAL